VDQGINVLAVMNISTVTKPLTDTEPESMAKTEDAAHQTK
jgi:hypothetical protein